MAKTKRKHLVAIAAKKKQRHRPKRDAKQDPIAESSPTLPSHIERGPLPKHIVKSDPLSQAAPTGHQPKHAVDPDPIAESSWTSPSHRKQGHQAQHDVEPDVIAQPSPTLPSHHDYSDSGSWIEVRKQRVIIIIPPLPKAQPKPWIANQETVSLPKDAARNPKRKRSGRADQVKVKGKLSNTAVCHTGKVPDACAPSKDVNNNNGEDQPGVAPAVINNVRQIGTKRKWKSGNSLLLNRDSKRKRSASHSTRKNLDTADPPISSMDILLASAFNADHDSSRPWQEGLRQQTDLLVTSTRQEDASLDTADSSIQPKKMCFMMKDVMQSSLRSNKAPWRHATRMRTSLHMPAYRDLGRDHRKPFTPKGLQFKQHATSRGVDVYENMLSPDSMDREEKLYSYYSGVPSILTANQAFKVSTLKKRLDKAGGLRKWLHLVRLDQFIKVFENRMWSEAELLQLTMDDLKKMGKPAVGPRRKLIWALNHVSQQLI